MILTCPACATSYFVPDEAIGPNGRRVRCKACGHDWRATLEDAPLELEPQPAPTEEADAGAARYDTFAETPAPELPRAFRAMVEQKRRARRAAATGAAWAAAAAVALGLLAAAVLFREEIVRAAPATAGAYKALGLEVNVVGLEFEAMRGRAAPHDPGRILVSGAVRNIRDVEVVPPPIQVVLSDARRVKVASRVVRLDGPPVLPGQVQGFAVVIPDPQGRAAGLDADFLLTPPAKRADPSAQRPRAAVSEAVRDDGVRDDGASQDGGLRRLSVLGSQAAPLDTAPAQGVSPGHG